MARKVLPAGRTSPSSTASAVERSVHREESQGRELLEHASRVDRERTLDEQEGVHEREGRVEGDDAALLRVRCVSRAQAGPVIGSS